MSNNLAHSDNVFDSILNCHSLDSNILIKTINTFCSKLASFGDLFVSRFCFVLENDIILLEKYFYQDDNVIKSNENIFGFDFVNHEHLVNLNLNSTLQQYSLGDLYTKYCQYLNKLVFNIIIHYNENIEIVEQSKKLLVKFQKQISDLKQHSRIKHILIKYNPETFTTNFKYSTKKLIEYLKLIIFDFKIDIAPVYFIKLIDNIKHKQEEKEYYDELLKEFELLMKHTISLDTFDEYYETPLAYASRVGLIEVINKLIENQANINAKCNEGQTALMYATISCNLECLFKLIEYNANINIRDDYGTTALDDAVIQKCLDSVLILIENGANINNQGKDGMTVLMDGSYMGHMKCVLKLIENGANVNAQDSDGMTAIMYAAEYGQSDCLLNLIEFGADLNIQDNNGMTALMFAAKKGCLDCLKLLIENGANINVQDENGRTALMYCSNTLHLDCILILVKNGANNNIKDKCGENALCFMKHHILMFGLPDLCGLEKMQYQQCIELLMFGLSDLEKTNFQQSIELLLEKENVRKRMVIQLYNIIILFFFFFKFYLTRFSDMSLSKF